MSRTKWMVSGLMLVVSSVGPICRGQGEPAAVPVTHALAPAAPAGGTGGAASPEDIAFAKRLSNAFKSVASHAEPSVVNITQLNRVLMRRNFFDAGQVQVRPTGLGSGFIVSRDGYILTNNHVVAGAAQLKVKFNEGKEYDAKLIGRDEATDLAVIKIDPKEVRTALVPLSFGDSETLDVGEWVLAIGSPFGLSSTVTAGIVSAKGRSVTPQETGRVYEDFIQTDAAINPGNSGGPLLNLQGEVVGINSAIASRTGGYEGIGFAIPSNVAKAVMENIIANGKIVRGWMGVDLSEATQEELAGVVGTGVTVKHVMENSPAEKGGLQDGDVITKFNGKAMNEPRLRTAIAITPPGTQVPVEVVRSGKAKELSVTLGDQNVAQGYTEIAQLGVTVRTITREMAQNAGVPDLKGVVVVANDPDGRAAASGLKVKDIIVAAGEGLGTQPIATAEDLAAVAAKANFRRGIRLNVIRDDMQGFLNIRE